MEALNRLIRIAAGCNPGMNTAANNQASNVNVSVEETVAKLGTVCHVCEVKGSWALVHASPIGVGRIVAELGLSVHPSKKGGEYFAVKVAAASARHLSIAPAPVAAPIVVVAPAPVPARSEASGPVRMDIGGTTYSVKETPCKRRVDVRRWEVRKLGDEIGTPYVVTFQATDGSKTACSCKGGIFHKHCKHMDALQAAHGRVTATSNASQVA